MDRHELERELNPITFVDQVAHATPGWSDKHGGPEGVALLCSDMQQQITELSETIAAIRVAAVQELLKTKSGVEVSKTLGISKAAISKINRNQAWEESTW